MHKEKLMQELRVDPSGLVWGYWHGPDNAVPLVAPEAVMQVLAGAARSDDGAGFHWLHFNLSQASTEKWLRDHAPLPQEFFEALQQGSRSTRIEQVDGGLIAVVNDVLHGFNFEPSELSTIWLWVTPQLVVSARRKPLKSVDRLRQAVQNGAHLQSSVELLTHLLRDQADVLIGIVRDTVARADNIEDDLLSGRLEHKRSDLGGMRRVLVRLQRLMAPEPAALFRLLQRPPAWISDSDLQELRQSSEEFAAVLTDMASLQERIKLLQEEIAAMINEENSKSLYTLTVVTVAALPINLIAGLFGMNVAGIPLADHEHGFWWVLSLVVSMTTALLWTISRKRF